ncbi:MAG: carbon-nitrogen hydrolase family protein [Alphaproteobacteria bacterium]|nr:carbon-nitrogen hydrolase family protein [Alphaproteobacteria bacterium]
MTSNPKIAIVQEAPVFLNLEASMEKAIRHIEEAANQGANVIAFAECWLPGYPLWLDFAPGAGLWDHPGSKTLYRLLAENSVQQGDKHLARLQEVSTESGCYIVMGTHERAGKTLYNTSFYFSPGAETPAPHRKLIPTYTERLVWGRGDGSTLATIDTPWGALGGLICWEHWMPLARAAMHAKDEAIHIAQWPVVKEMNQVSSRHYAFEGRCVVAAAGSIMSKADVLAGLHSLGEDVAEAEALLESMPGTPETLIHNGGSAIIAPDGRYLTEPLYDKPGILMAEADMKQLLEESQALDTAGHYARPDVFELKVNTRAMPGVSFEDEEAGA